jgi:hypothetical protein
MWQPDSAWQMPWPDVGLGPHERLQQFAPVHVPFGEQSSPAVRQPPALAPHVPVVLPAAIVH